MSDDAIRRILDGTRTIAVVGLSSKPDRPSYEVAAYLQRQGYRIVPVNPRETEVLGETAYASLDDVPARITALMEERKKKLAAEGLFDEARKQLLPWLPEVIGVVTSPTGAVIRDILHQIGRAHV